MGVKAGFWQLPVRKSKATNKDWIVHNAKYHYFIDGYSICKYEHWQNGDTDIPTVDSEHILVNKERACKDCLNRFERMFG